VSTFYLHFLSVALRFVFRSWFLYSQGFQITPKHSTLGRILRTSDHTLRPTSDNKQHSEGTEFHALEWILTLIRTNERVDPRLKHLGHRDWLLIYILIVSGDSQHTLVTGKNNKTQDSENNLAFFINTSQYTKNNFIFHSYVL